jgi:hypothetical protein
MQGAARQPQSPNTGSHCADRRATTTTGSVTGHRLQTSPCRPHRRLTIRSRRRRRPSLVSLHHQNGVHRSCSLRIRWLHHHRRRDGPRRRAAASSSDDRPPAPTLCARSKEATSPSSSQPCGIPAARSSGGAVEGEGGGGGG